MPFLLFKAEFEVEGEGYWLGFVKEITFAAAWRKNCLARRKVTTLALPGRSLVDL